MTPAFLIASCRFAGLMQLLETIRAFYPGWSVRVCGQGFTLEERERVQWFRGLDLAGVFMPELVGPYRARLEVLRAFDHDLWCNLDDDTLLVPETNYKPVVDFLGSQHDAGLVSCGWVRSAASVEGRPRPRVMRSQPIVYTGGGLFYGRAVADLIRAHPVKDYLFDNVEWSLVSYLSGRMNYRYRGSLAVASSATRLGRREWVHLGDRVLPDSQWVRLRPCQQRIYETNNNFHIPESRDLTRAAHLQHRASCAAMEATH